MNGAVVEAGHAKQGCVIQDNLDNNHACDAVRYPELPLDEFLPGLSPIALASERVDRLGLEYALLAAKSRSDREYVQALKQWLGMIRAGADLFSDSPVLLQEAVRFESDPEMRTMILDLMASPDQNTRFCMVRALSGAKEETIIDQLIELCHDTGSFMSQISAEVLSANITGKTLPHILEVAINKYRGLSAELAGNIARCEDPRVLPFMHEVLRNSQMPTGEREAARYVVDHPSKEGIEALKAAVINECSSTRLGPAGDALVAIGTPESIRALVEALRESKTLFMSLDVACFPLEPVKWRLRNLAFKIGEMFHQDEGNSSAADIRFLIQVFKSPMPPALAYPIAEVLAQSGDEGAFKELRRQLLGWGSHAMFESLLGDAWKSNRRANVACALRYSPHPGAKEVLEAALNDSDLAVRMAASQSLWHMA